MLSVNLLKEHIAGFTGRFMVVTTHSLGHNFLYTNIGFAGHSSFTVIKTADPKKINGVHLFGVYISPVSGRHPSNFEFNLSHRIQTDSLNRIQ